METKSLNEINRLAQFLLRNFPEAVTLDNLSSPSGPVDVAIRLLSDRLAQGQGLERRYRVTGLVNEHGFPFSQVVEVDAPNGAMAKYLAAREVQGCWTEETEVERVERKPPVTSWYIAYGR